MRRYNCQHMQFMISSNKNAGIGILNVYSCFTGISVSLTRASCGALYGALICRTPSVVKWHVISEMFRISENDCRFKYCASSTKKKPAAKNLLLISKIFYSIKRSKEYANILDICLKSRKTAKIFRTP